MLQTAKFRFENVSSCVQVFRALSVTLEIRDKCNWTDMSNGRIMDDLSPLLTQSTSNKQGKTLVECILDIIAAPELQVH